MPAGSEIRKRPQSHVDINVDVAVGHFTYCQRKLLKFPLMQF